MRMIYDILKTSTVIMVFWMIMVKAKRPPDEETAIFLQSAPLTSHELNYLKDALEPSGGVEKVAIKHFDNNHLLASPVDLVTTIWHHSEIGGIGEIILPCRPTSSNVKVDLFLNGINSTNDFPYDEGIGFIVDEPWSYNYTCLAQRNNITDKRIIFLHIINLKISPDLSEYKLNSTEYNRVFTCKGNEPVQWYFEQYDGSLLEKNSQSGPINSKLPKDENNFSHATSFKLVRATYLDTGYYYCAPLSAERKLIKKFKKIYIYIEQELDLFAFPDNYNNIRYSIEDGIKSVIIPCRPTTQDIKIKLYRTGDSNEWKYASYNDKIGFTLLKGKKNKVKNFTCVATKNNITRKRKFIEGLTSKPNVYCINSSKSGSLYCKFGNLCIFEFLDSGKLLSNFNWTYTICTNKTSSKCFTFIKDMKIPLKPVTHKCIITLSLIDNGILTSNVSNAFRYSSKEYLVASSSAENLWMWPILYILIVLVALGTVLRFFRKSDIRRDHPQVEYHTPHHNIHNTHIEIQK